MLAAPIKPAASFEFEKKEYQQREPMGVLDTSYSPAGEKITRREWMTIIDKKRKTSSNLSLLLKSAEPGQYEIFLRVKDQTGLWSDWVSRKIWIKKSQPISIMGFKTEKKLYAIGEKIDFIYPYDNPNGLKVKSQKWTYKNLATGIKVAGKPKYFKKAGNYEVTMQVQDEWGNWSVPKTCSIKVGTSIIERNGYYLFMKGKQGDLLEGYIDKDYNTFEDVTDVQIEDKAGTLIVSNSPERISTSGILYRDTVKGKGRLLVHHQNAVGLNKKLVITATLAGSEDSRLYVSNQAVKGPDRDILGTGQAALRDYFKGIGKKDYILKPGKPLCIYDSSLYKAWNKEDVISGLLDFESNTDVTFTVAVLDTSSSLNNLVNLSILKRDQHIRGTFCVVERSYTVDAAQIDNPAKLVLGKSQEEWITGKDALTGESVKNMGNYGVSVLIKVKNHGDMGIVLNARGGGYQGAIKWGSAKVFDSPREEVLSNKKIATLIGMIKANQTNQFVYMLPNGSSAPVLFGFVPQKFWK
jgi:hypothetical protein